jgi:hypothetical protein
MHARTHIHTHTHTSLREPFRTQSAARGTWRKRFYSWPIRLWRLDVGRVQFQRAGAMRQVIYIQAHTHTHAHAHTHTHTHTHTRDVDYVYCSLWRKRRKHTNTHMHIHTYRGPAPAVYAGGGNPYGVVAPPAMGVGSGNLLITGNTVNPWAQGKRSSSKKLCHCFLVGARRTESTTRTW